MYSSPIGPSAEAKTAATGGVLFSALLDPAAEPEFDRITRLATRLLRAPTAALTFIDEHREFLKSATGWPESIMRAREVPISHSFCKHVIATDGPIAIEDARENPLVCGNPAIQELGIIAYLGVPIHTPEGQAIASLCVIDHQPRQWTTEDVEAAQDLAASAATEIALRWQLEQTRRLSQRFEHFINASPAALYIADIVEKRVLFSSTTIAAVVGSTPETIARQGAGFSFENVHPDDRNALAKHVERMRDLEEGKTASFEYRLRKRDGKWHWVLARDMALHRDETGAVRVVIGSVMEIDDLKRAEQALRESEERLEMAMKGAELGMWNWDIRTGEVIYNQRWAEMLGYELEEITPTFSEWESRVHPEDKARVLAAIEAHARGQTPYFTEEHRMRAKDGTWRWILTSGKCFNPDAKGQFQRAAGIHLDITARKEAEAASRASDRKLAGILESMDEACSAMDADYRYTFINRRWETLFGCRAEDVIGRTVWEIFPDTDGTPITKYAKKAMTERIPVRYEVLSPVVHRWMQVRIFPAADGGLSTFSLDVHERKLAEERLLEASKRKDDFIAMLGHELRNPLAAIRHAVGLCSTEEEAEFFDWAKKVVDRQSLHLARLVDDLLDVSRMTRGKVELRKQRIDLAVVLDQTVEELRPLIANRRHELTVCYAHGELWVDGDAARLEQVFSNLLTNAAKYTPPGGRICLEARRESHPGAGLEQEVAISVVDSGPGIPVDKLPRMFDLFVQGERSLARSEGGLGLGLPIVKAISELHGGYVTAHSDAPQNGSIFTVHLPAVPSPLPSIPSSPLVSPETEPHRVLVVDDVQDTALGLARLLRRQGHTVEVAHDGPHACERAHTFAPEVVLLDIGMPGMDGYEVAQHLRHDEAVAHSMIVALTGYGQEEDRQRALSSGFDEHLVKPVDIERLKRLIGNAPHQRAMQPA